MALQLLLVGAGCTASERGFGESSRSVAITRLEHFISEESALLARPVDLDVSADGRVYILDLQLDEVIVVSASGSVLRRVGRRGQGPCEFRTPISLSVSGTILRVLDLRNSTINILDDAGNCMESRAAGLIGIPSRAVFDAAGRITYQSGQVLKQGALLAVSNLNTEPRLFGTPRHEVVTASAEELAEETVGERVVPQMFANHVLPIVGGGGDMWVFWQRDAILERYHQDGVVADRIAVAEPAMGPIVEEYIRRYEQYRNEGVTFEFASVTDAKIDDRERLWLLWRTPPGAAGLLTVHSTEGRGVWRLVLPLLDDDTGGIAPVQRRIALDMENERVYLSSTGNSTVSWFSVPTGLR